MRGIEIILNDEVVHTGDDLGLVQEVKEIGKPEIQSYSVKVPGRNGLLNLTKGLTGKVMYYNRPLKFQYFGSGSRAELLRLEALMLRYHGETVRIIDDDYPEHYYEGEVSVSTKFGVNYITISLSVDAQPFRLKNERTVYSQKINGDAVIYLDNESIDAVPTITVTAETEIIFKDMHAIVSAGTYVANDFMLHRGVNVFEVSGTGTITIEYQEGAI